MAIHRTFEIVDQLARSPEGLSLAELSARLGAPKSSLLSLLRALTEMAFASREGDRYRIGPGLFNLASAITSQWGISPVARPIMQRLHQETGETIVLAALDRFGEAVQYIEQIESVNPVRFTVKLGDTRPLYCSGAGRVLLAFQEPEWRERYLASGHFPRITEATVTDPDEIRRRIERTRAEGVGTSSGEVTDGGASYAAPVFQRDGTVHYALLVATVAWRLREKGELLRAAVMRAAADLSRAVGYEGPFPLSDRC
jgi:DNA-binding IclR family transcriptional regulator